MCGLVGFWAEGVGFVDGVEGLLVGGDVGGFGSVVWAGFVGLVHWFSFSLVC